jgi:hypothetical protein
MGRKSGLFEGWHPGRWGSYVSLEKHLRELRYAKGLLKGGKGGVGEVVGRKSVCMGQGGEVVI